MRLAPFFLSTLLFVVSAATAQLPEGTLKVEDIVTALKLKKKGTLPFGFKPGASVGEIKSAMGKAEVFKEDSAYITYTVYFSDDKYDFGDITFDFDNGKLTDVSIETYFGKKEPAKKALNLLKQNFDKLYKPGEFSNRTLQWKYAKKGVNLWIQMNEVEFEGDNGFVVDFLTTEPKTTE